MPQQMLSFPKMTRRRNRADNTVRRLLAAIGVKLIAGCFIAILWSWSVLLRKNTVQLNRLDRYVAEGHQVLAIFWHGKYLPLFPLAAGREVVVITVDSFRGRVIAAICRYFGYKPVLLSTNANSHGFSALAQQVHDHAGLIALALDGPLGPYHRIRTGALYLSAVHGAKLAPIGVASARKLVFGSRWDKQEAPLPFSRVAVAVGDLIDLSAMTATQDPAQWEAIVRSAMISVEREAQELLVPGAES
jgi:lysophospholipid acyltransferase (LPLAT)-like uncharacterized protein